MLIKKQDGQVSCRPIMGALSAGLGGAIGRRAFLRRSGIAAGGAALATTVPAGLRRARRGANGRFRHSGQCRRDQDHLYPLLRRLHGRGRGRQGGLVYRSLASTAPSISAPTAPRGPRYASMLRYPMSLSCGKWTRIPWDQAIDEVGDAEIARPRAPTRCIGWARPSSPTKAPIWFRHNLRAKTLPRPRRAIDPSHHLQRKHRPIFRT